MPFIAKLASTGERVDITRIENPRQTLQANDLVCQLCENPMIVRAGMIIQPHFAHRAGSECTSTYAQHPESPEHRLGKRVIAEHLRREMAEYSDAEIEYEVPIPEVHRVADVMVIFPNGWRVAHECQLAGITTEELQQRTRDYLHAGIDVNWWLGKTANTPANRDWCIEWQGFVLELDFARGDTERQYLSLPENDARDAGPGVSGDDTGSGVRARERWGLPS